MAYPTTLTEPLPLDGLLRDERALAALELLRAHGADAVAGLDAATVPLLARAAAEPGIVEYCPNDRSRFGDVAAAERWASKGRGFVAVVGPTGVDRLLAYGWSGAFRALREKLDPNRLNGGVLLGLTGLVVKSHGGTDAEGFAYAINVGYETVRNDLLTKINGMLNRDGGALAQTAQEVVS